MKSPTNQVIQDAIDRIAVSARHENGWADGCRQLSTAVDLRTAINALHIGMQAFIQIANSQLADLKSRLNATVVRVDSLPIELIESILLLSFPKDAEGWHGWREILLSISRKWHNIVNECPLFWNQIHDGNHPVLRDIQRSGNTPLHLYLPELPRYHQAITRDWRPFASCKDRWVTFEYHRDSVQQEVLDSLANANPKLRSLRIIISGDSYPVIRLPGNGQSLQSLIISGASPDWQQLSPPSPFLRFLDLSELIIPPLPDILSVLLPVPLLEGLLLQYCDGPEEVASEMVSIHLPHLTVLVLRSIPYTHPLFSRIVVGPSCGTIILDPVPIPTEGTSLFSLAMSLILKRGMVDVTSHGLHHEQVVLNTIYERYRQPPERFLYSKSFADKGLNLTIPEMETNAEVVALWDGPLFDFLKSLPIKDVHLKIGVPIPPDENDSIASWDLPFPLRYLDALPITDMVLGGGVDGRAILRHLTTEHSSCPKLSSLNMSINDRHHGFSFREEFQEGITAKWGHPVDPEDLDSLFELTLGDGETTVYWVY